jgi:excisionase family DNA binding protein
MASRKAVPVALPDLDHLSLLWPRSMSVETAARYIDATPWNVEELCRSRQIVAYKQGKRWTVDRFELDRYVARRHAEAAALLSDFVEHSGSKTAA